MDADLGSSDRTLSVTNSGADDGRLMLLVARHGLLVTHLLPSEGRLSLGRSTQCDVHVNSPSVSRRHLALHIGSPLLVEDLGSSNGTLLRGGRISPHEPTPFAAGDLIEAGDSTLLVQLRRWSRSRYLWTHADFHARLQEECSQGSHRRNVRFTVARIRLRGSNDTALVTDAAEHYLHTGDVLAVQVPGDYEALLLDTHAPDATQRLTALVARLESVGMKPAWGVAHYPLDGSDADALLQRSNVLEDTDHSPLSLLPLEHPGTAELHRVITRVADSSISVLLTGETGVGKEVYARRLHQLSPRATKPLVCVNCAAFTETLVDSELFGHEKGAFTGADRTVPGLLESAHGGTVFLDEVGELPPGVQARLLRALEHGQILRIGGRKPIDIDVRFIAATNRDLTTEAAQMRFRRDLFYRLAGVTIAIPPLRERRAEIEPLARYFIAEACRREYRELMPSLSAEAIELLENYPWPGNVRELKNVISRALLVCSGTAITPEHLLLDRSVSVTEKFPAQESELLALTLRQRRSELERRLVIDALKQCDGNQSKAARLLGISRKALIVRMDAFSIPRRRKAQSEPEAPQCESAPTTACTGTDGTEVTNRGSADRARSH
jgi:DNA-binding NtrC family response regulator